MPDLLASSSERTVFRGRLHAVVELDMRNNERTVTFERVRRAPGTRLLIVSPQRTLLLTREYRYETGDWDMRLPGGKVFDRLTDYEECLASGEDIVAVASEAARREAREEAGVAAQSLELFHRSPCGATVEWDLFYFVVHNYEALEEGQQLEDDEHITLRWYPLEEVRALCLNGSIGEDRSVGVLLRWLAQELGN